MESILDIIYVPLAWIFKFCYIIVNNYGVAILLFALIAKLLLLPLGIKGEKGRLKMTKVQPKINALQQKFKGNTKDPKYNEELQELYKREGYNPLSGCLPQLVQLPIILGLWNAIRQPLTYITGLNKLTRWAVVEALVDNGTESIVSSLGNVVTTDINAVLTWLKTNEIRVAQVLNDPDIFGTVMGRLTDYQAQGYDVMTDFQPINMHFLGLDLGATPSEYGILAWTTLIPVLSALTSFLFSYISQKLTAQPSPDGKKNSMNMLMYTMPLISLWFAFSFQTGVGIYWIFSNLLSVGQVFLLRKIVKAPVDDEKPVKEKKLNYNQIEKQKRLEAENPVETEQDPFEKYDNPDNK